MTKTVEEWKADRDALLERAVFEVTTLARGNMHADRAEACRRDAMIYACVADSITNKLKHDVGEFVTTFQGKPFEG